MRFATALALSVALLVPVAASAQHGKLTANLKTSDGKDAGTAKFHQVGGALEIQLDLKNLPPGEHAVHVHDKPVCDAPDFKGAGGHFDPDNKQHGYDNPLGHHNGDLPKNVTVLPDGTAHAHFSVRDMSLGTGKPNDILHGTQLSNGASIMVHADPDDMKTDPSGNSGARIACGVIQGREVTRQTGN